MGLGPAVKGEEVYNVPGRGKKGKAPKSPFEGKDPQKHKDWMNYKGLQERASKLTKTQRAKLTEMGFVDVHDQDTRFRDNLERANKYGLDKGLVNFTPDDLEAAGVDPEFLEFTSENGDNYMLNAVNQRRSAETGMWKLKGMPGWKKPEPEESWMESAWGTAKNVAGAVAGAAVKGVGEIAKGVDALTQHDNPEPPQKSSTAPKTASASVGGFEPLPDLSDPKNLIQPATEPPKGTQPENPNTAQNKAEAEAQGAVYTDALNKMAPRPLAGEVLIETPDGVEIGDVNKRRQELDNELFQKTFVYLLAQGHEQDVAKHMADELLELSHRNLNEGFAEYLEKDGWRSPLTEDLFGYESDLTQIIGKNPLMKDMFDAYRNQHHDLDALQGHKLALGSKITQEDVDYNAQRYFTQGVNSILKGSFGWIGADVDNAIDRLGAISTIRHNDRKAGLWDAFTKLASQDFDGLPIHLQEDLKVLLAQDQATSEALDLSPDVFAQTIQMGGELLGSIKGGSFKVATGSLSTAMGLYNRLGKTEKWQKLMALPLFQRTSQIMNAVPEVKDGANMAAVFMLSSLLEEMPDGDAEQLIGSGAMGFTFGSTGRFAAERIMYPLFRRTVQYQKVSTDPKLRKAFIETYGEEMMKMLDYKVSVTKERAYLWSNILANPAQGWIANTLQGQEYELFGPQGITDMIFGPMLGLQGRKHLKDNWVRNKKLTIDPESLRAAAAAQEAYDNAQRASRGKRKAQDPEKYTVKTEQPPSKPSAEDIKEAGEHIPDTDAREKSRPEKAPRILESMDEFFPLDQIQFDEPSHTYTVDGNVLPSVTTLIGQHPDFYFDKEAKSKELAAKRGVKPEDILDEWDEGAREGTIFHNAVEDLINDPTATEGKPQTAIELAELIRSRGRVLSERLVWSDQIAGTIDVLVERPDGTVEIMDIKTMKPNADPFSAGSTYESKKYGASKGEKHRLQLLAYRKLLESKGLKVSGMYIIPINRGNTEAFRRSDGTMLIPADGTATTEKYYNEIFKAAPRPGQHKLADLMDSTEGLTQTQNLVFDFIKDVAGDTQVRFDDIGEQKAYYDRTNNIIVLNNSIKGTDTAKTALIHEGFHAATAAGIRTNSDLMAMASKLRDEMSAKKWFQKWAEKNPEEAYYMMSNPDEFLAAIVDNKYGIAKHIDKRSQWAPKAKDKVLTALYGDDQGTSGIMKALSDLTTTVKADAEIRKTKTHTEPTEKDLFSRIEEEINYLTGLDERSMEDEARLATLIEDYEQLSRKAATAGRPMEESMNMFSHLQDYTGSREIVDPFEQQVISTQMAEFIANAREFGIKDEVAYSHLEHTYFQDDAAFAEASPIEKMQEMNRALKQALEDPSAIEYLQELSRAPEDPAEVFNDDWANKPTFSMRELKSLFHLAESEADAENIAAFLDGNMGQPETFTDRFIELVDRSLENSQLSEDRRNAVLTAAELWATKYYRNNHNAKKVTPLGMDDNGDLISYKGMKYYPHPDGGMRKVQDAVQNPTALRTRLSRVAEEALTSPLGKPWYMVTPQHRNLVETLVSAELGLVNGKPDREMKGEWHAKKAGKNAIENGWFLLAKGFDGAVAFDLSSILKHKSGEQIREMVKQLEEVNLLHYLGSERLWGPGQAAKVAPVLGSMDLWKLVEVARTDQRHSAVTPDNFQEFLTDNVKAKHLDLAMKKAPELVKTANEVIDKLRSYYEKTSTGAQPAILHKVPDQHLDVALGSGLNHFYSKIWDTANINDQIKPEGKFPKDQSKYAGVTTQFNYINLADPAAADLLLRPYDKYPSLNIGDLPIGEERAKAMEAGHRYGISWDDNGNPKLKMFILDDAWAQANPELYRYFTTEKRSFDMDAYEQAQLADAQQEMFSLTDFVSQNVQGITPDDIARETGLKLGTKGDVNPTRSKRDGATVEQEAHRLWEESKAQGMDYSTEEIRDAIIENLSRGKTKKAKGQDPKGDFTDVQLIPPSELHDGASWIFNPNTWEMLAEMNGHDPNTIASIKYGYAGDRIYKSNFSNMLMPEPGPLKDFLQMLTENGYSGIIAQSAIKSKARNYRRASVGGKDIVFDDNGKVKGEEVNGEYREYGEEDVTAYHSANPLGPEKTIEFKLTGDDSWGYIKSTQTARKTEAPTLSLDKTPFVIPGYGGSLGEALRSSIQVFQHNIAKKTASTLAAWEQMRKVQDLYKNNLYSGETYAHEGMTDIIETMIEKLSKSDDNDPLNERYDHQQKMIRDLDAVIRPDGTLDVPTLSAVWDMYPGLFTSLHSIDPKTNQKIAGQVAGKGSMISQIVGDAYKTGTKLKGFGAQMVLHPYIPHMEHMQHGMTESRYWKEKELRSEAYKKGFHQDIMDQYVQEKLQEYDDWAQDMAFDPANEIFDATGKLVPYGHGVILSAGDLETLNRKALREQAKGKHAPIVTVGSKVLVKLTPSDALDSYVPAVVAGIDPSKNGGMMMNNDFLVFKQGRDFDGDDEGLILESDEWVGKNGSTFLDLWDALKKEQTHKGAKVKEDATKESDLRDLRDRPFQPVPVDMRSQHTTSYRKTLNARGEGDVSIGDGVATLNQFYSMVRSLDMKDGDTHTFNISDEFGHHAELTIKLDTKLLDKNDAFYKQAQYDTYGGYSVSPDDVFFGSRIHEIKSDWEPWVKSIKQFNETGVVDQNIKSLYNKAANRVVPLGAEEVARKGTPGKLSGGGSMQDMIGVYMNSYTTWANKKGQYRPKNETLEQRTIHAHSRARKAMVDAYGMPEVGPEYSKLSERLNEDFYAVSPSIRFNPHRIVHEGFAGKDVMEETATLAVMSDMFSRGAPAVPRADIPVGPVPDGLPTAMWKIRDGYVSLETAEGRVPLTKAVNPDGAIHPAIQSLLDQGLTLDQVFPGELTGFVSTGRLAKNVLEEAAVVRDKVSKDPGNIWVRFSAMDNIKRDRSYDLSQELPNLEVIHYGDIQSFERIVERAKEQGQRVKIDIESHLPTKMGPMLDWLDTGRLFNSDRNTTDDSRARLKAQVAGALDKMGDFGASALEVMTSERAQATLEGLQNVNYQAIMPDGRPAADVYFENLREGYRQDHSRRADDNILGMFSKGKDGQNYVEKFKASDWGLGKASGLNRLNRYLGHDITQLSSEELEKVHGEVDKFFRETFPEAGDAAIEKMAGAFSPEYLRRLEEGAWKDLRQTDPKAEEKIRAKKAIMALQSLQAASKMMEAQGRGKFGNWWEIIGVTKGQSIQDRVNAFGNDTRMVHGDEVVAQRPIVSVNGTGDFVVDVSPVRAADRFDRITQQPDFVSLQSDTWVRHGEQHRILNGIKDMFDLDLNEMKRGIAAMFGTDKATGQPQFTTDVLYAAEDLFNPDGGVYLNSQGEVATPQSYEMSTTFTTQGLPATAIHIGGEVFTTGPEGFFTDDALNIIAEHILPTDVYSNGDGVKFNADLRSAIKLGVQMNAFNQRHATYLRSLGEGIKNYVTGIKDRYKDVLDNDPEVFKSIDDQLNMLYTDLIKESNARGKAGMLESIQSNRFVDREIYAQHLHNLMGNLEALKNEARENETDMVYPKNIVDMAESMKVEPEDLVRQLRQRMRQIDRENTQMGKTTAFFEQESTGRRPSTVFYDTFDSRVMQELFREENQYDLNMIYELTQDLNAKAQNRMGQIIMQTYRTERAIRKTQGMETLDNPVAENNMLVSMVNDDMIWDRDHDVHSSKGIRSAMTKAATQGRRILTAEEMGMNHGDPIVASIRTGEGEVLSLQGRLVGIGRIDNKVVMNKALRDMVDNVKEEGSPLPDWANEDKYEKHKDMLVMVNRENGSLHYLDLASVQQLTTGERYGKTYRWLENQEKKYFRDLQIQGMDAMEYLLSGVQGKEFQGIDLEGKRIQSRTIGGIEHMDIPFFAEVPRQGMPTMGARVVDRMAKAWSQVPSHWLYGFGKQAFGVGAGIAIGAAMANPAVAWGIGAYYVGSGVRKYALNRFGNSENYRWRGMITGSVKGRNSKGETTLPALIRDFARGKGKENDTKGPEAAIAMARIGSSAGLASDATSTTRSMKEGSTIPLVKAKKRMERVKNIVDGWGEYLKPTDIERVNQVIKDQWGQNSRIEANIRNGRLSLHSYDDTGKIMKDLTELRQMNLDQLNEMMIIPSRYADWMGNYQPHVALNNTRMQIFKNLGGTEATGMVNSAQDYGNQYRVLQRNKAALSNMEKRIGFVQSMVDVGQGKFDERPLDMRTPLGRFGTLFSQYSRNYFRRTGLGFIKENLMYHDILSTYAEDKAFTSEIFDKLGIDLGDERVQSAFTGIKVDKETGEITMSQLRNRSIYLQGAFPLIKKLTGALIVGAVSQIEWVQKMLQWQADMATDMIMGDDTPIGTAVKFVSEMAQLSFEEPSDKEISKQVANSVGEVTRSVPVGVLYKPVFDISGLVALYGGSKAGLIPQMDDRYVKRQLQRTAALTFMPLTGPLAEVPKIQNLVEKHRK